MSQRVGSCRVVNPLKFKLLNSSAQEMKIYMGISCKYVCMGISISKPYTFVRIILRINVCSYKRTSATTME